MRTSELFSSDAEGGEVCGCGMIATIRRPSTTTGRTYRWSPCRIYVDADRHSTGVAAGVDVASLDFVRPSGYDWIWLGTNEANTRAVRFYEKYGFRIVGKRTFCVADSIGGDHVLARPAMVVVHDRLRPLWVYGATGLQANRRRVPAGPDSSHRIALVDVHSETRVRAMTSGSTGRCSSPTPPTPGARPNWAKSTTVQDHRRSVLEVSACRWSRPARRQGPIYADLAGEVLFMRESIERYDAVAKKSGARIVHASGSDLDPV